MFRGALHFFILSFFTFFSFSSFAQWTQSDGPYGGQVDCLASVGNIIFAGTYRGIFGTNDGGANWARITTGLTGEHIDDIAESSDGTVVVATNGDGVFNSSDFGATWHTATGLNDTYIDRLMKSKAGSYFCFSSNVYRSTDKGNTWQLSGGSSSPVVGSFCADSSGNLFIVGYGNTYTSTDDGISWVSITPGLPRIYCTSLVATNSGILFAATDSMVWRSSDHGHTWSAVNIGAPANSILTLSAIQNSVYAAAAWNFYQSSDGGNSWSSSSNESAAPTAILITGGNHFFVGSSHGVERSKDGGATWATSVNGMTNTSIGPIIAKGSGDIFAASEALAAGVYHSPDNGRTWVDANLRVGNYRPIATMALMHHGAVIAGTHGSGMFRTSNNAASWMQIGDISDSGIQSIAVTSSDGLIAGTVHSGAYFSADSGNHWTKISQSISDSNIILVAVDSSDNYIIGSFQKNIYRSIDKGAHWTNISSGIFTGYLNSIAVNKSGTIFVAGYGQPLMRKKNLFGNWDRVVSGLPDSSFSSLTYSADTLFATFQDSGIYRSSDEGQTWQPMNSGLFDRTVNSLAVNTNGYLFAGTFGDGVYRSGALKAGIPLQSMNPQRVSVYPNPVSDIFSIAFDNQKDQQGNLKIYNSLGEVIDNRSVQLVQGHNAISYVAQKLPDGSYYFIINASGYSVGKFTVVHAQTR